MYLLKKKQQQCYNAWSLCVVQAEKAAARGEDSDEEDVEEEEEEEEEEEDDIEAILAEEFEVTARHCLYQLLS